MGAWGLLAALGLVQSLVVGVIATRLMKRHSARLGLIDHPTLERKIHDAPIPRSGGIAIFAAFWGMLWLDVLLAMQVAPNLTFLPEGVRALAANAATKMPELLGLFAGCSIIFVLGVADDRFNLSPKPRLAIQILACVPLVLTGTSLKLFLPELVAVPLTIFWLVLLTNSFNFLDNMNGLTSGVSAIICLVMGLMAALSGEWFMLLVFALLAGAVLGFWLHNFPRAGIFLGDSGSTHLGFLIGALAVLTTWFQEGVPSRLPVLMPLIVLGIPLFDTLSVLWIRWREGRPLMTGDTSHLSHRLVALGMSRTEAVLFIYGGALVLGLAAIPLRTLDLVPGILLACAIALIFIQLHWLERVSWRRQSATPARTDTKP